MRIKIRWQNATFFPEQGQILLDETGGIWQFFSSTATMQKKRNVFQTHRVHSSSTTVQICIGFAEEAER